MGLLFEVITSIDLDKIKALRPKGWINITSKFEEYMSRDFCYPIKISLDGRIIGLGCSIVFENTAWLAHIIVHEDFRNRGIGQQIVQFLLAHLKSKNIETYLLIATALGEPIYKKARFKNYFRIHLFEKRERMAPFYPFKQHCTLCSKVL